MKHRLVSGIVSFVLLAGPAIAQPPLTKTLPPGGLKIDNLPAITFEPSTLHEAMASSAVGHTVVSIPGPTPGTGALSGFKLSFQNGDHKLKWLGVMALNNRAEFALADQDQNDPFSASASWIQSKHFRTEHVVVTGGGEFVFDLPPPPANHTAVLQGFHFARKEGKDANIRLISIQITPDSKQARVALVDDQGADFRGIEEAGGVATGLVFFPLGAIISTPLAGVDAVQRFSGNEFGKDGLRNYQLILEVAYVPNAMVLGSGSVSGAASRRADSGQMPSLNDKPAIRGFRMYFGNSDHHIQSFGINLRAGAGQPVVSYQDSDTDDPVSWSVDWVKIK